MSHKEDDSEFLARSYQGLIEEYHIGDQHFRRVVGSTPHGEFVPQKLTINGVEVPSHEVWCDLLRLARKRAQGE